MDHPSIFGIGEDPKDLPDFVECDLGGKNVRREDRIDYFDPIWMMSI
ncbi:MAG: hypothetical protein GY862_32445 [Gammaproteobacteria bacterium]|nr:hypothetical protein [Gammaproteobacteria bacterium]